MFKKMITTASAIACLALASSASAFVFNGSKYSIVDGTDYSNPPGWNNTTYADFTWTEANADANSRGGHLATFGDSSEWNAVVTGLGLDGSPQYWLGGSQAYARHDSGDWSWVDGTAWGFTAWAPGEPNDCCSGWRSNQENYLMTWGDGSVWNDSSNGSRRSTNQGYILETAAAVPEPGTLALLSLGLFGLGLSRRRTK